MTFDEKNQIVILKDASFIDVFALIEFIYKGEVNIGQVSIILFYIILDFDYRPWYIFSPQKWFFNPQQNITFYRTNFHLF